MGLVSQFGKSTSAPRGEQDRAPAISLTQVAVHPSQTSNREIDASPRVKGLNTWIWMP